jgi:uridylate kinase
MSPSLHFAPGHPASRTRAGGDFCRRHRQSLFSTDTTAALRASEIGANIILKATKVDGIYDRDPKLHPDASRYDRISFTEALTKRLKVMDSTAFSLCMDNKIPILVFDMHHPTNVRDAVLGKQVGSLVTE